MEILLLRSYKQQEQGSEENTRKAQGAGETPPCQCSSSEAVAEDSPLLEVKEVNHGWWGW